MKAELTATIEGGVLKPDVALRFPDHTRVKLTIEPVAQPMPKSTSATCSPRFPCGGRTPLVLKYPFA